MSAPRVLRSNSKTVLSSLGPQPGGAACNNDVLREFERNFKKLKGEKKDVEPAKPYQDVRVSPRKKIKVFSTPANLELDLAVENASTNLGQSAGLNVKTEYTQISSDAHPGVASQEITNLSTFKTEIPRANRALLEQACEHLVRIDPRFKHLIEKYPCRLFSIEGLAEEIDPFQSLCNGILSQQVSGAAAESMKKKFILLFNNSLAGKLTTGIENYPQPIDIAASDIPFLRQAGLSERKAEYIKGLAEKFASGELSAAMLFKASDEEVMERLTAVRGLGKWSVEMFSLFGLKRMDVFSTGDLGVQYVLSTS